MGGGGSFTLGKKKDLHRFSSGGPVPDNRQKPERRCVSFRSHLAEGAIHKPKEVAKTSGPVEAQW